MTAETLSIAGLVISALALGVSVVTAWVTLMQRGRVQMTQPTLIYFGRRGVRKIESNSVMKVYLRTLLYSTGKRGQILENMFVRLQHGKASKT